MDNAWLVGLLPILLWIAAGGCGLLAIYGTVRFAISRGLRDHAIWIEHNQLAISAPPRPEELRSSAMANHPAGSAIRQPHLHLVRQG